MERELEDGVMLSEMADEEGDEATLEEARAQLRAIKDRAARAELEALLSGEADGNDAYLEVNSGAGGTESNDWAGMLLRMYSRWARAHGYEVEIEAEESGEQAGIKSATILITGPNAYGWLKSESGVHRLVRISPYDAAAKRHTSFASIGVSPVVDDTIEIDINPSDVRTDTYRASGAGGQHINKTDSAVRLTHIPTNTVVACQAGRSQHQNREQAWKMLRARLYELELQRREAQAQALADAKTDIGWGHQIRSYVLQPYQMVKDLRTEVETSDTQGVLDGDLDLFMGAAWPSASARRAGRRWTRRPAAGSRAGQPTRLDKLRSPGLIGAPGDRDELPEIALGLHPVARPLRGLCRAIERPEAIGLLNERGFERLQRLGGPALPKQHLAQHLSGRRQRAGRDRGQLGAVLQIGGLPACPPALRGHAPPRRPGSPRPPAAGCRSAPPNSPRPDWASLSWIWSSDPIAARAPTLSFRCAAPGPGRNR
jgi:peptide chain release factor 2